MLKETKEYNKHMKGFEKEKTISKMHGTPVVRKRLYQRADFLAVARVINPSLCKEAFKRRPCKRKLRYIGYDRFDEPFRSEWEVDGFVYGEIYHSVDFNGATYTIEETGDVVGLIYFEVVD